MSTDADKVHRGKFDYNENTGVCLKVGEYNPLKGKGLTCRKEKGKT